MSRNIGLGTQLPQLVFLERLGVWEGEKERERRWS